MIHEWLDSTLPAVLTTTRRDGSPVNSPVWFRRTVDALEVVIAEGDVKLRHLTDDPRCAFVVFDTTAPFHGLRIEAVPTLRPDTDALSRLAIAVRYLGPDGGERFVAARSRPGVVARFPLVDAKAWDLGEILP